jgi:hypothetical protein
LFNQIVEDRNLLEAYNICFMDVEWRYKNYNFFVSRPCDVYYILNFIETLVYKYDLLCQFETDETNKKSCLDVSILLNDFLSYFQILI